MSSPEWLHRSFAHFRGFIPLLVSLAVLPVIFVLPSRAAAPEGAAGQASEAPAPDVIVFTSGDQLTGKLLRVVNGTVIFHNDVVGDISVPWSKIKSIRTSQRFAVVQQGQRISHKTPESEVPKGTIEVQNDQVAVTPGPGGAQKEIPVKSAQYLIDEGTYTKEVQGHPGFSHGWTGAVTAGASQIEATQNSQTFTAAANAVRAVPNVGWLAPSSRTILDFAAAYGSISQPHTPTTKSQLIHGSAEEDWYLTPRFYALATAVFDHSYSQGLDLQQLYGAGFGYTLIQNPKEELDLKADIHFERQTFSVTPGFLPPPELPKNLVGADVGDTYMLKLPHGMTFNQGLVLTPSFNQSSAYSALLTAGLVFPVYKHFSFTVGALDSFLNEPAPGSKKNSFQYTGGLTYTF